MNFLLTVCAAAFLTYNHQVNYCNAIEFDLDTFMKNFEKSQSELKWIRDESHKNEGKDIEWADTKESNLDEDDESSVDHWYSKYRKLECSTDHGNEESKVLNGYCGVYDDGFQKQDKFVKSIISKDPPVSAQLPKSNLKDSKYEYPSTGSLFDEFDNNVHEEMEQETFDLNDDTNLSPDEKLDLDEYNEQMIPNPNFYKINNELHLNDQQINKDHDNVRSELGFSPGMSQSYPSSADDVFSPIENDYGIEQRVEGKENKMKRNAKDFGKVHRANFNQHPYDHLSDQDDTRKNDLSHEADYKLSKSEQESQNKPKSNIEFQSQGDDESDIEESLNAEDKYETEFENGNKSQNEIQSDFKNTKNSYNNFKQITEVIPNFNKKAHVKATNSKPNFFPPNIKQQKYLAKQEKSSQLANEINLKISNRMMSKGLGPSLPSQSVKYHPREYRHPMNVDVENQHWRQRRAESNDYFTDYIGKQRHLLQFDYEDSVNSESIHENSFVPNEKSELKNDFSQILDSKPNNGEVPNGLVTESQEKRNLTESVTETSPDNSTISIKSVSKTNTNQSESNSTFQAGHVDSIKLQLDLKISNATSEEQTAGDDRKIVKRSVSFGKPYGIQETKIQGISKNSSIRDLVSGKLPNQLIQAVFQLVKENSRLNKVIGSKLDMKTPDNLQLSSINLFKSKDKTEKMVKKLMSSITDLIDEQITHQTCITLPPDLQSFYDKVLYVRSINSRVSNMRKQDKSAAASNKNSTKRFARSTIPESDIHQKYKTVGQLLKQFSHLKLRDQVKIFDIKEFLQNHIQLLDDLKTLNSELVRKSRSVEKKNSRQNNRDTQVAASEKREKQISRKYANLLKTTKLIKTTSLTDMDRMDVISTY